LTAKQSSLVKSADFVLPAYSVRTKAGDEGTA